MFWAKIFFTAALVAIISEVAQWSDRLGALIAALPLMTLMVLIWMQFEGLPEEKLASHARYTFWYVLPTLPMFYCFPFFLRQMGFWGAVLSGLLLSLFCFAVLGLLLQRFEIQLW